MIKAIIFDFDGTIANSFDLFIEVFQRISKKTLSQDDIDELRGLPTNEILRKMNVKPWQVPQLILRGRKEMGEKVALVKPFDTIAFCLEKLQRTGYKLFIISTNSRSNVYKFLEVNELDKVIHDVTGNVGLFGKPRALKALKKRMAYHNEEVVYVGDETRDIVAAKKAGIRCIAVAWGFNTAEILKTYSPDEVVAEPKDLYGAVRSFENNHKFNG